MGHILKKASISNLRLYDSMELAMKENAGMLKLYYIPSGMLVGFAFNRVSIVMKSRYSSPQGYRVVVP